MPRFRRYTSRVVQLTFPPPGFEELSTEEKLEYVQALWDYLSEHSEDIPVFDWHREIVGERLAAHRRREMTSRAWSDVQQELLTRLRTPR